MSKNEEVKHMIKTRQMWEALYLDLYAIGRAPGVCRPEDIEAHIIPLQKCAADYLIACDKGLMAAGVKPQDIFCLCRPE